MNLGESLLLPNNDDEHITAITPFVDCEVTVGDDVDDEELLSPKKKQRKTVHVEEELTAQMPPKASKTKSKKTKAAKSGGKKSGGGKHGGGVSKTQLNKAIVAALKAKFGGGKGRGKKH